jgi:hypothetical protein
MEKVNKRWTQIQTRILRSVRRQIVREPTSYEQTTWAKRVATTPCGTAACIAGWVCFVDPVLKKRGAVVPGEYICHIDIKQGRTVIEQIHAQQYATRRLGLVNGEQHVLFSGDPGDHWPGPFGKAWKKEEGEMGEAAVAAAYITFILETGLVGNVAHYRVRALNREHTKRANGLLKEYRRLVKEKYWEGVNVG